MNVSAPSPARTVPLRAAELFNGYIGSSILYALQDLGLTAALREGSVDLGRFAADHGLEPRRFGAMVAAIDRLGYVKLEGGRCELTDPGRRLLEELCYFTCTVGGYGELFRELAGVTRGDKRFGGDVPHRLDQVAKGRQQYSRQYEVEVLDRTLDGIEPATVVDLASGDGSFLLFAGQRWPDARLFGVDVDGRACAKARARLEGAGMARRATIVESTIDRALEDVAAHPGLGDAGLVTNFALLHHLIDWSDGAGFLRGLRTAFPRATHFLFSDITAMGDGQREGDVPIFSLAYELFHVFMDLEIQTLPTYVDAFRGAGLEVVRHNGFGQPNDQLWLLSPVAGEG